MNRCGAMDSKQLDDKGWVLAQWDLSNSNKKGHVRLAQVEGPLTTVVYRLMENNFSGA